MLTDSIDGYLARRFQSVTPLGAILDPVMDKFFVSFALVVLIHEGRLSFHEGLLMLSRDFFLCAFGLYLVLRRQWKIYSFRSVRWGKATTALQFFVLIGLALGYTFPLSLFGVFFLFGFLTFWELCADLQGLKKHQR